MDDTSCFLRFSSSESWSFVIRKMVFSISCIFLSYSNFSCCHYWALLSVSKVVLFFWTFYKSYLSALLSITLESYSNLFWSAFKSRDWRTLLRSLRSALELIASSISFLEAFSWSALATLSSEALLSICIYRSLNLFSNYSKSLELST
jgi:hypothetical protein